MVSVTKRKYWFTIAWDGEFEGEYSTNRPSYDLMIIGIKDYLEKWKDRKAYLRCCSEDIDKVKKEIA